MSGNLYLWYDADEELVHSDSEPDFLDGIYEPDSGLPNVYGYECDTKQWLYIELTYSGFGAPLSNVQYAYSYNVIDPNTVPEELRIIALLAGE